MRILYFLLSSGLILFCAMPPVQAQAQIVRDSLYSTILQEQRNIEVIFPRGYNPNTPDKYEVLYCLEGISDFVPIEYNYLAGEGFIPNLILVGLPNSNKAGVSMRDRDFTPTHTDGTTGGADKFLSFLKEELLPYMQKRYPVKSGSHSLYGGSLGGLFVMYAFLSEPTLFTSYIAVDPSLWWDNFCLNKLAVQRMAGSSRLHNTLWLAGREGSAYHYMGIAQMDSILQSKAPRELVWKCQLYSNETHYSTQFKGLWDGLKFSYGGFYASTGGYPTSRQIMIKPPRGLAVKGKPFNLICYNLADSPYIKYTIDGTEPTIASPSLQGEETKLTLDKNSVVRLKSFCVREEYNRVDSAVFEIGAVLQPVIKPAGIRQGGLNYAYYEGDWNTFPDLSKLTPGRAGRTGNEFDLSAFPVQTGYALSMEGYIHIERPGYYIFEMGGKNFKVWLHDRQILGDHIIPGTGEMYMVPLEKGFYPLRIEYLHNKNSDSPAPLYLKPEGIEDFAVPSHMLYGH